MTIIRWSLYYALGTAFLVASLVFLLGVSVYHVAHRSQSSKDLWISATYATAVFGVALLVPLLKVSHA